MIFTYGQEELSLLKKRDKRLGAVIDAVGMIARQDDGDLFSAVVRHMVGQQISTSAQATIWGRMQGAFGAVAPESLARVSVEDLQKTGITFRKAAYIKEFSQVVLEGRFQLGALWDMSDAEVITALSGLRGVGVWTAEMIMLFCMGRPDILSFGDLAIHRGMRMLYRHKKIDRNLFERYRRRYSPLGTVASLYLWAVAGGALAGVRDPADKAKRGKLI